MSTDTLSVRIAGLISTHKKRIWFSLEHGHGETYHSGRPTLYGHHPYPRHSVLAGREARLFIEQWDTAEEAWEALQQVKQSLAAQRMIFRVDDMLGIGTTHVPIKQIVSHLPDDTNY